MTFYFKYTITSVSEFYSLPFIWLIINDAALVLMRFQLKKKVVKVRQILSFIFSQKISWCDIDDLVFKPRDKGPHSYCNVNYIHVWQNPSLGLNLIQ